MLTSALALIVAPVACLVVLVADESGAVLSGAPVELVAALEEPARRAAFTDQVGEARFCALPPGDYEVRAAFDGFRTKTLPLKLGAEDETELRIVLKMGYLEEVPTDPRWALDARLQFVLVAGAWAGSEARDCGEIRLGSNPDPALECARSALAEGAPFFLFEPMRGIDSVVLYALASRGDRDHRFFAFDSFSSEQDAEKNLKRIHQRPCPQPELLDVGHSRIACF